MVFDDDIAIDSIDHKMPVTVHKSENGIVKENGDEDNKRDLKHLEKYYQQILAEIGEDPNRQGLKKTPERAAKAILDFTKGYNVTPSGKFIISNWHLN